MSSFLLPTIPLLDIANKPDLAFAQKLERNKQFSIFQDQHKQIASQLLKIFLDAPDIQNFASLCAYTKDRVNPLLFQYCYSVAVQHRQDTQNVQVPLIAVNFIDPAVLQGTSEEASLITEPGSRTRIDIPHNYTDSDCDDEQCLAYFREDIGANMHHWHWHLVYPFEGPLEIVTKDRRGELFYYMHHQVTARYNVERYCNKLKPIEGLSNLREPIPEGYFPKLICSANNRPYPARMPNTTLHDVNREQNALKVAECELWQGRILSAIDQGFVEDTSGKRIPLDEERGIDLLGNIVEASALSINPQYYGTLHNNIHDLISFSHDPDNLHLDEFGVMGDITISMRDPIFYRWHVYMDTVFDKFKTLLPPYDHSLLGFPGITIKNIEAKMNSCTARTNVLLTYWQKSDVDLAAGLDFGPNGSVYASFVHLQHVPFEYVFSVFNDSESKRRGTCRIFLCPQSDERGTALSLEEQRLLAIELDKFIVNLQPGNNTIRRHSDESSVTTPFKRTFRRVGKNYQPKEEDALAAFRYCGCGWPDHLLLPKGKPEGMPFDLFVMISDYAGDAVEQTNNSPSACSEVYSFCGLKDKLYPDRRPMGFPFDKRLPGNNLNALTASFSNMMKTDIVIIFDDRVVEHTD